MKRLIKKSFNILNSNEVEYKIDFENSNLNLLPPYFKTFIQVFKLGCEFMTTEYKVILGNDFSNPKQFCAIDQFYKKSISGREMDNGILSLFSTQELSEELIEYKNQSNYWHNSGFIRFCSLNYGTDKLLLGIADNVKDEIWRWGGDYPNLHDKIANDIFDLFSMMRLFICEEDWEDICGEDIINFDIDSSKLYKNWGDDFWQLMKRN